MNYLHQPQVFNQLKLSSIPQVRGDLLVMDLFPFPQKRQQRRAISTFNGTKLMGRSINVMFKDDNAKKNKSAAPTEEDLKAESSEQIVS